MNSKVIGVLDVIVINYCYHGTSQLYHGLLWEKFFWANFVSPAASSQTVTYVNLIKTQSQF